MVETGVKDLAFLRTESKSMEEAERLVETRRATLARLDADEAAARHELTLVPVGNGPIPIQLTAAPPPPPESAAQNVAMSIAALHAALDRQLRECTDPNLHAVKTDAEQGLIQMAEAS